MKKLIIALAVFAGVSSGFAQDEKEQPKEGWTRAGQFSLLFNQAAFNAEWQGGGTSNYAGNIGITYDFNYRKGKLSWDNKIIGEYGLTKIKDDEFTRKTNDRLEYNSILGRQLEESNWYLSFFLNFKTQFAKGYEFSEEEFTNTDGVLETRTVRTEYTHFLSPGYLQFGPGMLWKKSENLYVNIAPATARLIFVDSDFTSIPGYVDGDYFGVDAGESTRFEFGAAVSAYAKVKLLENVSIENILNIYSNYLEDPQNVDLDYTMNLNMKVNKYLSANVIFQAIYDDNAVGAFQIREVLGVGFNYGF